MHTAHGRADNEYVNDRNDDQRLGGIVSKAKVRKLYFEGAEMESEAKSGKGRFTYRKIFEYIKNGKYSEGLAKADKLSLRKRAKLFQVVESSLYYVGRKYPHFFPAHTL